MKIGVLGGTFDPVHRGHIMVAEAAGASLGLARVILVPAGQPRFKPEGSVTPAAHRLGMLRLAVAGRPHWEVSTLEIERPGPSYTVDTIAEMRRQYGDGDDIYFIMGWGSLAELKDWREPERIIRMCYLVAVPRPGIPHPDIEALEDDIPGISRRVIFLGEPNIDISASEVKGLVARGLPFRHLVPGPVADYIIGHGLYSTQEV